MKFQPAERHILTLKKNKKDDSGDKLIAKEEVLSFLEKAELSPTEFNEYSRKLFLDEESPEEILAQVKGVDSNSVNLASSGFSNKKIQDWRMIKPEDHKLARNEKDQGDEKFKMISENLIGKIQDILEHNKIKIGEGRTAEVYRQIKVDGSESSFCLKVIPDISKLDYTRWNSVARELEYLDKVSKITAKSRIKVPKPWFALINERNKSHVLVMEYLDAVSFKDVFDERENLPKNFQEDLFFTEVNDFLDAMRGELGILHADISEGNVLVDRQTGSGVVVDFGRSREMPKTDQKHFYDPATDYIYHVNEDQKKLRALRKKIIEYLSRH